MKIATVFILVIALLILADVISADGSETLGPPTIPIEHGSGVASGGTGMSIGFGTIEINVPPGAEVEQVILYWSGEFIDTDDDRIWIGGHSVDGDLIGGPTIFFETQQGAVKVSTYRADITSLGLVSSGPNVVPVADLDHDWRSMGAGLIVVYKEIGRGAEIMFRDGSDLAYLPFEEPLDSTVPQTFTFRSATTDRIANLTVMAGSVGGENRPNAVEITIGGVTTTLIDPLFGSDGPQWDTLLIPIDIPASITEVRVQVLSRDDGANNPASLNWIAGSLSVPLPPTAISLASFEVNTPDTKELFVFGFVLFLLIVVTVVWIIGEVD